MMNEISDLELELNEALLKSGLPEEQDANREYVIGKVKDIYVEGNPRAWWERLRFRETIYRFSDDKGYLHLKEVAPIESIAVWLIVDEDNERKLVYKIPIDLASDVISECRFFEYYVAEENYSWLIAENDHGDLIVCKKP